MGHGASIAAFGPTARMPEHLTRRQVKLISGFKFDEKLWLSIRDNPERDTISRSKWLNVTQTALDGTIVLSSDDSGTDSDESSDSEGQDSSIEESKSNHRDESDVAPDATLQELNWEVDDVPWVNLESSTSNSMDRDKGGQKSPSTQLASSTITAEVSSLRSPRIKAPQSALPGPPQRTDIEIVNPAHTSPAPHEVDTKAVNHQESDRSHSAPSATECPHHYDRWEAVSQGLQQEINQLALEGRSDTYTSTHSSHIGCYCLSLDVCDRAAALRVERDFQFVQLPLSGYISCSSVPPFADPAHPSFASDVRRSKHPYQAGDQLVAINDIDVRLPLPMSAKMVTSLLAKIVHDSRNEHSTIELRFVRRCPNWQGEFDEIMGWVSGTPKMQEERSQRWASFSKLFHLACRQAVSTMWLNFHRSQGLVARFTDPGFDIHPPQSNVTINHEDDLDPSKYTESRLREDFAGFDIPTQVPSRSPANKYLFFKGHGLVFALVSLTSSQSHVDGDVAVNAAIKKFPQDARVVDPPWLTFALEKLFASNIRIHKFFTRLRSTTGFSHAAADSALHNVQHPDHLKALEPFVSRMERLDELRPRLQCIVKYGGWTVVVQSQLLVNCDTCHHSTRNGQHEDGRTTCITHLQNVHNVCKNILPDPFIESIFVPAHMMTFEKALDGKESAGEASVHMAWYSNNEPWRGNEFQKCEPLPNIDHILSVAQAKLQQSLPNGLSKSERQQLSVLQVVPVNNNQAWVVMHAARRLMLPQGQISATRQAMPLQPRQRDWPHNSALAREAGDLLDNCERPDHIASDWVPPAHKEGHNFMVSDLSVVVTDKLPSAKRLSVGEMYSEGLPPNTRASAIAQDSDGKTRFVCIPKDATLDHVNFLEGVHGGDVTLNFDEDRLVFGNAVLVIQSGCGFAGESVHCRERPELLELRESNSLLCSTKHDSVFIALSRLQQPCSKGDGISTVSATDTTVSATDTTVSATDTEPLLRAAAARLLTYGERHFMFDCPELMLSSQRRTSACYLGRYTHCYRCARSRQTHRSLNHQSRTPSTDGYVVDDDIQRYCGHPVFQLIGSNEAFLYFLATEQRPKGTWCVGPTVGSGSFWAEFRSNEGVVPPFTASACSTKHGVWWRWTKDGIFAQDCSMSVAVADMSAKVDLRVCSSATLSSIINLDVGGVLHREGLNCWQLGRLRRKVVGIAAQGLESPEQVSWRRGAIAQCLSQCLLAEMLCRCVRRQFERELRKNSDVLSKNHGETKYNSVLEMRSFASMFLRRLCSSVQDGTSRHDGNETNFNNFWHCQSKIWLRTMYHESIDDEEGSFAFDLRKALHPLGWIYFWKRLPRILGISIVNGSLQTEVASPSSAPSPQLKDGASISQLILEQQFPVLSNYARLRVESVVSSSTAACLPAHGELHWGHECLLTVSAFKVLSRRMSAVLGQGWTKMPESTAAWRLPRFSCGARLSRQLFRSHVMPHLACVYSSLNICAALHTSLQTFIRVIDPCPPWLLQHMNGPTSNFPSATEFLEDAVALATMAELEAGFSTDDDKSYTGAVYAGIGSFGCLRFHDITQGVVEMLVQQYQKCQGRFFEAMRLRYIVWNTVAATHASSRHDDSAITPTPIEDSFRKWGDRDNSAGVVRQALKEVCVVSPPVYGEAVAFFVAASKEASGDLGGELREYHFILTGRSTLPKPPVKNHDDEQCDDSIALRFAHDLDVDELAETLSQSRSLQFASYKYAFALQFCAEQFDPTVPPLLAMNFLLLRRSNTEVNPTLLFVICNQHSTVLMLAPCICVL